MKGVIYARYSSDNQREESIEGQVRECKALAEKNDIQIIEIYIDRALSAKTDNRPDFQRLIKDSGRKKFEVMLVWKLVHRRRLIDSFANAIYLYDDRITLVFNFKDGTKTITFAEFEESGLGSDINALAAFPILLSNTRFKTQKAGKQSDAIQI